MATTARSMAGKSKTDLDSGETRRATYGACHRCGWIGRVSRVGRRGRRLLKVGLAYGWLCEQCTMDLLRLTREHSFEGSSRSPDR